MRRFLIILAALVLVVPATWLLQQFVIGDLEHNVDAVRQELSARTVVQVQTDFEKILNTIRERAISAASDRDALFLLSTDVGKEPDPAQVAAARRFRSRQDGGAGWSVELFDTQGRLVAWSGFSMLPPPATWPPLVDGTVGLESDAYRTCLRIWYPAGPLGYVRVIRVAQLKPSTSASDATEDLSTHWSSLTGHLVEVAFGDSTGMGQVGSGQAVTVALENASGRQLGEASVSIASTAGLVREGKRQFGDLQGLWFLLLMAWLFAGAWTVLSRWFMADRRSYVRFVTAAIGRTMLLAALRYSLLGLNIPGRWFRDSPAEALFDPVNLASSVAWGAARSAGDLLGTTVFALLASIAVLAAVRDFLRAEPDHRAPRAAGLFALSTVVTAVIAWHALLTRRAMLDATLDFFAWTGLKPEPMVLVVFCSLLLSTIATVLAAAALGAASGPTLGKGRQAWISAWAVLLPPATAFAFLGFGALMPIWLFAGYVAAIVVASGMIRRDRINSSRSLRLRPIVAVVLLSATLLYPLVYLGMDAHRRLRVIDVAEEFIERSDDQALANAGALLQQMASSSQIDEVLFLPVVSAEGWINLARSLPASEIVPGVVSARVTLYDKRLRPIGGYQETGSGAVRVIPAALTTGLLTPADTVGAPRVDILRNPRSGESLGYEGIAPAFDAAGNISGWLTARFDRHRIATPFGSLFGYSDWRRSLSLAEFRDGVRVRNEGEDFERYTIPVDVVDQLATEDEVWRNESVYGRAYLTYYLRVTADEQMGSAEDEVVAVRARAVIPYDHLYYLLRMALSGLWFALPIFLVGLAVRYRRGELPAKRAQIGDRVLDAFMFVGTLAVLVMGLVGQQVIMRENEGAIRSRLERRLERVENALQQAARPNEALYDVQSRLPLDSLAQDLSLDLNVYKGPWLAEHSQTGPDVLPLMGYRLPPEAYDDLFLKRFRQSFVETTGQFGFVYTVGYKALMDAEGNPVSIVAVLTAPEQERIREERARTTAYFFGALLILLLVILGTATVLASALAGPITRLRDGLRSVAEGKFQQPIPVESRDEVGELVETFNLMQSQLAESRRRLAQQERELAWREMARQVAHEIKNPLTPMKLSIQHLQRAFEEGRGAVDPEFESAFRRITKTVSDQIEALASIANEFSTFARMPKRHMEHLDANEIVREAISLLQEETGSDVSFTTALDPAIVDADRDELRRVFINLIKNAQQATTNGGTVSVHIRSDHGPDDRPDEPMVVIEIVDTGQGISAEVRDKIFQPNFSTKTSGMGLGLAIAKKSVEEVRGEIGFTTDEGSGSTFWVRLPAVA